MYFSSVQLGAGYVIHRLAAASNENLCSICVKISVELMFAQFDVIVFIGRFSKYCATAEINQGEKCFVTFITLSVCYCFEKKTEKSDRDSDLSWEKHFSS
jgi:hypothetical protein